MTGSRQCGHFVYASCCPRNGRSSPSHPHHSHLHSPSSIPIDHLVSSSGINRYILSSHHGELLTHCPFGRLPHPQPTLPNFIPGLVPSPLIPSLTTHCSAFNSPPHHTTHTQTQWLTETRPPQTTKRLSPSSTAAEPAKSPRTCSATSCAPAARIPPRLRLAIWKSLSEVTVRSALLYQHRGWL